MNGDIPTKDVAKLFSVKATQSQARMRVKLSE
jgi:hypothetical protein